MNLGKRAKEMDVTELHDEENLLLRLTLGMGCKQRSVKSLAQQMGTTQKAIQKTLLEVALLLLVILPTWAVYKFTKEK